MKTHYLTLALATFAAASTPTFAQAPASQTDKALMPGSTTPLPLPGGKPNPHEGHASVTCDKGPDAEVKNATRPECANMGLPTAKAPPTHKPTGTTTNNGNPPQ